MHLTWSVLWLIWPRAAVVSCPDFISCTVWRYLRDRLCIRKPRCTSFPYVFTYLRCHTFRQRQRHNTIFIWNLVKYRLYFQARWKVAIIYPIRSISKTTPKIGVAIVWSQAAQCHCSRGRLDERHQRSSKIYRLVDFPARKVVLHYLLNFLLLKLQASDIKVFWARLRVLIPLRVHSCTYCYRHTRWRFQVKTRCDLERIPKHQSPALIIPKTSSARKWPGFRKISAINFSLQS